MARPRIGIWLVGAKGGVATTTIVGLVALRKGLRTPIGLVSALPRFAGLAPTDWPDFVVGGHEIRAVRLADEAAKLSRISRALDPDLVAPCRDDLDDIDRLVRPGTIVGVGPTIGQMADAAGVPPRESPAEAVERLSADLAAFARSAELAHVIVINVASTEPPADAPAVPDRWAKLEPLLAEPGRCPLPASSLYAIAALRSGCSYVNFTPSLGSAPAAIGELARLQGSRHMGCDGKTGETLMKSVLAPMFAQRNLAVLSWVGHNIFGNLDGKVLADPANKKSKLATKDHLVRDILGYAPQTLVSIEYIESLGDWKTAWDHVHFQGFLGTPMTLQFIWQGCDSLLAAPLVLDLARFTELAWRRGHVGRMPFLASFFKSPQGVAQQDFTRQFQMLEAWADGSADPPPQT
ncbi:MAG: inositol-3-phosphate synthase [Pirellulales bacterium]|nr:inositol-3-phosphate synthase [Pirellulales bacterium]